MDDHISFSIYYDTNLTKQIVFSGQLQEFSIAKDNKKLQTKCIR